jgi:hypothetical protein
MRSASVSIFDVCSPRLASCARRPLPTSWLLQLTSLRAVHNVRNAFSYLSQLFGPPPSELCLTALHPFNWLTTLPGPHDCGTCTFRQRLHLTCAPFLSPATRQSMRSVAKLGMSMRKSAAASPANSPGPLITSKAVAHSHFIRCRGVHIMRILGVNTKDIF